MLHYVSRRGREEEGDGIPWEDRSVNNVDVVCTIYLSIQVDNCISTSKTTIGSDLSCSDPMVGATVLWPQAKLVNRQLYSDIIIRNELTLATYCSTVWLEGGTWNSIIGSVWIAFIMLLMPAMTTSVSA